MPNISEKVCWFVNESACFSSFSRSFSGCTCSIHVIQCYSIKRAKKFSASGNTVKTVRLVRNEGYQMKEPENNAIQLFEDQKIRVAWDAEREEWYFSVQDVVAVLSESTDPKQYIKKMRARDPQLSANWGTICTPVQMPAAAAMSRAWREKRWKPRPASRSSPRRTPSASVSSSRTL